jgi:hypothetical protein
VANAATSTGRGSAARNEQYTSEHNTGSTRPLREAGIAKKGKWQKNCLPATVAAGQANPSCAADMTVASLTYTVESQCENDKMSLRTVKKLFGPCLFVSTFLLIALA